MYKVIEAPWVYETISAQFDASLPLLTADAIVFGGAVRDTIAGMPLKGDMDVVVVESRFAQLRERFEGSNKWRRKNMPRGHKPYNHPDIAGVVEYMNIYGNTVQIIQARSKPATPALVCSLAAVEHVDFICCGIAMDYRGVIYEVVSGAFDDCVNKVLRANGEVNDFTTFKSRLTKLKGRGWKSKVLLAALRQTKSDKNLDKSAGKDKPQIKSMKERYNLNF